MTNETNTSTFRTQHALSRRALSRRALSRRALSRHALSRHALSRHALSRRALSRRALGAQALLLVSSGVMTGLLEGCTDGASSETTRKQNSSLPQYGFWHDTRVCIGCGICVDTCDEHSKLPEGSPSRRKVVLYVTDAGEQRYVSSSCMHCEEPACVSVCPTRACTKGEAGIVAVDKTRCIGCKYCFEACPFGVPHYLSDAMDKCDCCLGAGVLPGSTPYCAQKCPTQALHFGPIEDLEIEASVATDGASKRVDAPTYPAMILS